MVELIISGAVFRVLVHL